MSICSFQELNLINELKEIMSYINNIVCKHEEFQNNYNNINANILKLEQSVNNINNNITNLNTKIDKLLNNTTESLFPLSITRNLLDIESLKLPDTVNDELVDIIIPHPLEMNKTVKKKRKKKRRKNR
jgi:chromosome segregation ATPase